VNIMIDTYVQNLHAERHRAWAEQKSILDSATAAKRELTAEERQTIERTDEALDKLDAEIKGWLDRAKRDAEFDTAKAAYEPLVRAVKAPPADEFGQFVAFMRGERPGNVDNGRAWEFDLTGVAREKNSIRAGARGHELLHQFAANDPAIRNALSSTTAALGGNLVPTDFVRSLYDYLEMYTGMRRTGATIITTEGGNPLEFPKVVTGGTATVVGEGSAVGTVEPTFGKMTLNAWKYAEMVRVPIELIQDNGVDLEGFLARDFGRAIGRASNTGYTTGTGTNQPEGVMSVIGTAVTGANGGTGIFSFDDLIDLEYAVNSEYAANGAVWMMNRTTTGRARRLKTTANEYLWQPSNIVGQPDLLDGYPVIENPAVSAVGTGLLSVAFGDFSAFYIRDVGAIRISRSDDRYFDTDEVAWKATLRTDSGLIDLTGAVKAYRGGTA
jgi:HK97 family phage major capsid protein